MKSKNPTYRTPKAAPFERLTWDEDGTAGVEPNPEDEAVAAIMALGGFHCARCQGLLREADGYVCCYTAHCPFCGTPTASYSATGCCEHQLYRNTDDYWSFDQAFRRGKLSVMEQERWNRLLQPTPPGRRLPGQKGPGYPHWTDAQKAQAYTGGIGAHLAAIFTPTLRIYSSKRLHPVLLPSVRPELKTQLRDIHGHRHDHYFSADTDEAMEKVAAFMTALEAGTQRLRAMPPECILRAPGKAEAE